MKLSHILNSMRYMTHAAIALMMSWHAMQAHAQANPPASFALIGHIEKFTLDTPGDKNSAAKITVRGIDVVLPRSLIITMPGGYVTAEQLFRGRNFKTPETPQRSGMALMEMTDADMTCPPPLVAAGKKCPLPAAEVELTGNVIGGVYIAGIARISQGGLHIGAGFIRSIDSNTGFFTVGADLGTAVTARLRMNDPEGIYGPKPDPTKPLLLDMRFALDPGNSPIHARTGFPVCLKDNARLGLCPDSNRATNPNAPNYRRFTCGPTPQGATEPVLPGCQPHLPIPLRVGDYINYVGMLDKDDTGYFISLHGLEAEIGAYTSRGLDPAYTFIEEALQGTKGALYPLDATTTIPQEETTIYKIVGFCTDASRNITVEIFDDDANTGPLTPTSAPVRLATKIVPMNLAQLGRFKMNWAAKEEARVVRRNARVMVSAGTVPSNAAFAPGKASNEMTAPLLPAGASVRGGYAFGQFEAPVNEYISPETTRFGVKGWPVPVNFEDFCFLKNTNVIDTQEPDPADATGYIKITATAATPSPINPARPRSQLRADGTRVCGD
jgi:hypothetical protein